MAIGCHPQHPAVLRGVLFCPSSHRGKWSVGCQEGLCTFPAQSEIPQSAYSIDIEIVNPIWSQGESSAQFDRKWKTSDCPYHYKAIAPCLVETGLITATHIEIYDIDSDSTSHNSHYTGEICWITDRVRVNIARLKLKCGQLLVLF
jgi:hypothetical protein